MIAHLWHSFLALHPVGYVAGLLLVALGWVKRKVISTAIKTASGAASNWLRNTARKWLGVETRIGSANERTYKGTFSDFGRTRPDEWFVTLVNNDVATKVRVHEARLFFAIQMGTFVEMDTEVVPGRNYEVVRRVRVHE